MKQRLVFILLLVLAVGAGAAYFWRAGQSPSDRVAVQEAIACPHDKAFCAYMLAQAKAMQQGVTVKVNSEMQEYGSSMSEIKMDGAGNVESTTYSDGEVVGSMIVFAGLTYIKDMEDDAWYMLGASQTDEQAGKETQFLQEIKGSYDVSEADAVPQIKSLGQEACGSMLCEKYELLSSGAAEANTTTYLWFDTDHKLARRMETTYEAGKSVMEYSYDEVKITKPSPIKDMPSMSFPGEASGGANMTMDAGEMPSQEEIEAMMQEYGLDH